MPVIHVNGNPVIQPLQVPDPGPINAPTGIPGSTLTLANNFSFNDADPADTHTVISHFNPIASGVGAPLGTFVATEQNDTVNGNNGVTHWDYQVSADAVNALPTGSVRHEVFDVIVADDQGATATHEVMITINGPPNNAPVIHDIAGTVTVTEDVPVLLTPPPTAAVTDADFDNLTMTVHVSHGKITATSAILDAITSGTLTEIDGDGTDGTLVVSGSPSAITAAIQAGLTYTPNHDFNGPDALDVSITDGHGGTASASLTIDVTPVNDAPVATITPVSYSATEQTSLSTSRTTGCRSATSMPARLDDRDPVGRRRHADGDGRHQRRRGHN